MLELVPKRWMSWSFTAHEQSQKIGDFDFSMFRERAVLQVRGLQYSAYRTGMMGGAFILEPEGGAELARAEKPSAFRERFEISHAGRSYTLINVLGIKRRFVLMEGLERVGSINQNRFFSRQLVAHFPDEIPAPVQMFIVWLGVLLWRRDSSSD